LGSSGGLTALTYKLEALGTTITPYISGIVDPNIGAKTDASIASGYAGLITYGAGTANKMDNWVGDNVGAAPTSTPTNTFTPTPTFTFTPTPTFTPTFTPTPFAKALWKSVLWHSPAQEGVRFQ